MPQFGSGHEDYEKELAALDEVERSVDSLNAREAAAEQTTRRGNNARAEAAARAREQAAASREAAEVAAREAAARNAVAESLNVETAAIERNRRAREAANTQAQRAAALQRGAVAGARDPRFGEAYALGGPDVSQYRLRQEMAVGQQRAARLQSAAVAGFRPGDAGATQPFTRTMAGEISLERSKAELEQANRELANARRRQSTTDEERAALIASRDAARQRVQAAKIELESAQRDAATAAARAEAQAQEAAIRREAAAREAASAAARPGNAIVPHPQWFGHETVNGELMRDVDAQVRNAQRQLEGRLRQLMPGEQQVLGPGPMPATGVVPYRYAFQRDAGPRYGPVRGGGGIAAEGGPGHGSSQAWEAEAAAAHQAAQASNEYLRSLNGVQREAHDSMQERAATNLNQVAANSRRAAAGIQSEAVSFGMASQAMMRHGALSSEYIQAAMRGETTLREVGNQAAITAGKFGGWLAVGSGIYAVADAARQVGTGAIQGASGVDSLRRVIDNVNPDQAIGDFARLSADFNVPIEVATDAVYRMGQVFHDQGEATNAAQAALYAYVTGGVDVATGTQQLISVQQALGASSGDLLDIFDQLNAAQNEMGATIPDMLAGYSKAIGVFSQAGGDPGQLLDLLVSIQRLTGVSGREAGTGVARAVNQFRLPEHVERLQAQGVKVNVDDISATIKDAMRAAREGGDINEIARGIFGNQYARLFAPVLSNQDTMTQAARVRGDASGASEAERAHVLAQADQQITAIGNHLQAIGAQLARAGVFAPFIAGLRAVNATLSLVGDLIGVFNQLPSPLRQVVAVFGEGYLLLQGMRRLGATDALAGGKFGFLTSPDQRIATYARRGARDEVDAARDEHERYRRTAYRAAQEAQMAQNAVNEYAPRAQAALVAPPSAQRTAILEDYNQRESAYREAMRRSEAASRAAASAAQVVTAAEAELETVRSMSAAQIRQRVIQEQRVLPAELSHPSAAGTVRLGPNGERYTPSGIVLPGGVTAPPVGVNPAEGPGHIPGLVVPPAPTSREGDRLRRLAGEQRGVSDRMRRFQENARYALAGLVTYADDISGASRGAGIAARGLESAGNRAARGVARAGTFAGRALTSFRGLPGRASALAASMGVLDVALIGYLGGELANHLIEPLANQMDAVEAAFNRPANSPARIRDIQRRAQEIQSKGLFNAGDFATRVNDLANPVQLFGHTLPDILRGEYETPTQRTHRLQEEAAQQQEEIETRRRLQRDASAQGRPRPAMNIGDVMRDIQRTNDLRKQNVIDAAEFDRRMGNHAIEIRTAYMASKADTERANRLLTDTLSAGGGSPTSYAASLKRLPEADLDKAQAQVAGNIGTFGPSDRRLQRLRQTYGEAVARWGSRTNDAEAMRALAEAREAYFTTIEQTANEEVQRGLSLAGSEGERRGAYRRGRTIISRNITQNARARFNQADEGLRDVGEQIQNADPRDRTNMDALLKRQETLRRVRSRARRELTAAERKAQLLLREMDRAAFEDRQQGRQIRLALAQSQDPDAQDQAAAAVKSARASVRDAADQFGRHSREYQSALTELNNARTQAAQATVSHIQAENALMMAQAGNDPAAQARAGVAGARRVLAEMNGPNAGRYSEDDRLNAQAELITAQNQQDQQVADDSRRLAELQAQIAAARAGDDPVAQARAAIQSARAQMRNARNPVERAEALLATIQANNQLESALADREDARQKMLASESDDPVVNAHVETRAARRAVRRATPGTQGYFEARTRLNEAQRAETQARIDSATDDIDFARTMGRIDIDEAITRYQRLLQIRNLSKSQKRQIQRAIKGLQDEAESQADGFNMDVGNLKLPTAYDVRRAFDPIRQQVKAAHRATAGEAEDQINAHAARRGRGRTPIRFNPRASAAAIDGAMSTMYDQRAQVNASIVVHVNKGGDEQAVYDALDRVLGTTVRSKARSARRRG